MAEPLVIERDGAVEVWRLSRPEAKNALDWTTFGALGRAIDAAAENKQLRAVVLTGEGDTFCAGGDLRELRTAMTREDAESLCVVGRRVCDGIRALPIPVIAAITGPAIGGGAELAVACDMRIIDTKATISFKHARMGVTTAWGILPKLVSLVGPGRAAYYLFSGDTVDAERAHRSGLVNAISKSGRCVAAAMDWALEFAHGAPAAVASIKALLAEALGPADAFRAAERDRFVAAWTSEDHREAVEAFFASREPLWTGR
jgi:enoyl-CoA hydratase